MAVLLVFIGLGSLALVCFMLVGVRNLWRHGRAFWTFVVLGLAALTFWLAVWLPGVALYHLAFDGSSNNSGVANVACANSPTVKAGEIDYIPCKVQEVNGVPVGVNVTLSDSTTGTAKATLSDQYTGEMLCPKGWRCYRVLITRWPSAKNNVTLTVAPMDGSTSYKELVPIK
jgi:hypothetical protein